MIYYARLTAKKSIEDLYSVFYGLGALKDEIIIDKDSLQKEAGSTYMTLRTELQKTNDTLCIDSLSSLGKNYREISKELHWLCGNNIELIVADIPSSQNEKCSPVNLLAETYSLLANTEIENVKKKQRQGIRAAQENQKPLGRTRIPYPENWAENYLKWEQKKITSAEFLSLTGLKKGTFYNLIKQYRIMLSSAEEA